MSEARSIEELEIEIPTREAFRLLGIPDTSRTPRRSMLARFDELLQSGRGLIRPRAVLRPDCVGLSRSAVVPPTLHYAAVVCTIGEELETRVAELSAAGDATGAMILDAIGSAAAEEAANRANHHVCETAIREGRRPARRRSPGYHPWDVEEQRLLFELLEPADIGITLTPSCMMVPRKSVSFVVPLDGGWPDDAPGSRCSRCGLDDCPYREEDAR